MWFHNPHALKLEPSEFATIKKLTGRTKRCQEKKKGKAGDTTKSRF